MKRIMWALAILIIPAFVIWGAGSSDKKRKNGPDYAGKIFNRKVSFEEYIDMWQVTKDYATKTFGANIPREFIDELTWNRILLLEIAKRKDIAVNDSEVIEKLTSFPIFQREGNFDKKLYKSILGDSARGFEERLRDDIRLSKLQETIVSNISITEDEVLTEYKKKYEKIKASYISIPFKQFDKEVKYTEQDVIKFYEKNKEPFRRPDEINIKYIEVPLSRFDKEVSIEETSIQRYYEEHLDEFKKKEGEGSEEIPTLNEDIKKQISEKLASQRKKSLAEELAYKALDSALRKKSLDEAIRLFTLETKETGFFNMHQEIPNIGWSYELTQRGFELAEGEICNVLIKLDKGFYILQLKEKKKSYIPEFAEVKDTVLASFIKNGTITLAEEKAKDTFFIINTDMKNNKTFENIAKELQLEIIKTDTISRDDYIPALGPAKTFVGYASSLKPGEIAEPIKMLDSWVILRLDEYQAIDETKFLEEKTLFNEELLARKKDDAFEQWFEKMKKQANLIRYTTK